MGKIPDERAVIHFRVYSCLVLTCMRNATFDALGLAGFLQFFQNLRRIYSRSRWRRPREP